MRPEREVARALKDAKDRLQTARKAKDGVGIAKARREFAAALAEARTLIAAGQAGALC